MTRRPYGRDLGLTIRMGIALVPIVLWYVLMLALFVLLLLVLIANPSWETMLFFGLIAVGGPIALWEHLMNSESVGLSAARAKEVKRHASPLRPT
jgi:thiol:disulfide interchange protein